MARNKKLTAQADAPDPEVIEAEGRPYVITKAKIKDDYCYYSFSVRTGVGAGEEHSVKVDNVITDDMKYAFERFHVHLAVIDDVFKIAGLEIQDIDTLHNHSLTMLYHVTGFEVSGEEGDETIVLTGNKFLSTAHGRMDIKTPKITLDNLSSYQWYNELATAVQHAREEVALYKEGKFILQVEDDEETDNPKQLTIGDQMSDDFEKGKV